MVGTLLLLANAATFTVPATQTIDAGPLKLHLVDSDSAHVFHAYDQLSLWSQYCHRQYRRYFEGAGGGLSAEDKKLLAAHAEIRSRLVYGVLDETFYSEGGWEQALDAAIRGERLSAADALMERKVFRHFAPRVMKLVESQRTAMSGAVTALLAETEKLQARPG